MALYEELIVNKLIALGDVEARDDLAVTDDITVGGDAAVTGALAVTGNATVGGTLGVTGAVTITGAVALAAALSANGGLNLGAAANHSYASAHADWTLSAAEQKATFLTTTDDSADAGVNAIATPTDGKIFHIRNTCGQTLTIKAAGQTGIGIANDRNAIVRGNGTDFVRLIADQTL